LESSFGVNTGCVLKLRENGRKDRLEVGGGGDAKRRLRTRRRRLRAGNLRLRARMREKQKRNESGEKLL
jgi:hypothetical protein